VSTADLPGAIAAQCGRLGLAVHPDACHRLAAYATSLWAWNERLNLTRHLDVERFVGRDVADSLALARHLARGERVLDVGTGGGVPGAVLAILRPDLRVELCDSVAKKARAVEAIVAAAGLGMRVHAASAQAVVAARPEGPDRFDTLVVRAVAPLTKLLRWFEPLAGGYGRLLVIKGPRWEEEQAEARREGAGKKLSIRRIDAWPLVGTESETVLLEIKPRPA
jgi:16S rRNA (guanine527-N7)-methyltransferase